MTVEEARALSLLCAAVLEREQRPMTIRELQDALAPIGVVATYQQVRSACIDAMWTTDPDGVSHRGGPVSIVRSWAFVDRPRSNSVAFVARSAGIITDRTDLEAMWDAPAADRR